MPETHRIRTISPEDFQKTLEKYDALIPEKLSELEDQRLRIIPETLSERKPAYLTKTEVQTLVDWKLAHGTFRPSLRKLVESNSEETVEESTKVAFALYAEDNKALDQAVASLAKALRGIGPATASLLLSVYDSENIPFFSDELVRWSLFDDAKGCGWDRKIKYSIGEYKQLVPIVQALRKRLNEGRGSEKIFTALDAEKVAYAIGNGRDGADVTRGTKRDAVFDDQAHEATSKQESLDDAKYDGKKRRRQRPAQI